MSDFWRDRKVLVTGADGFIGSHLVETLVKLKAKVRGFVFYNSTGKWGWIEDLPRHIVNNIEIFPGDVRDPHRINEAVKGQEVVLHLASLIAIPYSYAAPDSYVDTNIKGVLNLLNAARAHKVKRFVNTSTSEVYGTARYVPIDEKHPLQPQSPYSASKIGADNMALSYYYSYNLPVTIVRPFNTYGPRQSARAVIPTVISQLLLHKKSIKLGALSPTRDFNYVADTVSGFLSIADSDKALGKAINIGSGKDISIKKLVSLIMQLTGINAQIVSEQERLRPGKSEVERLLCDASVANKLVGWRPSYTLEEGLKLTISWMKKNIHHYKSEIYNI